MTKPQILAELETLRDFVNDAGKAKLSTIVAAVQTLPEAPVPAVAVPVPAPAPAPVVVPPVPALAPEPAPAAVDRRSDERDPGQEEQISAEKLGLVGK